MICLAGLGHCNEPFGGHVSGNHAFPTQLSYGALPQGDEWASWNHHDSSRRHSTHGGQDSMLNVHFENGWDRRVPFLFLICLELIYAPFCITPSPKILLLGKWMDRSLV